MTTGFEKSGLCLSLGFHPSGGTVTIMATEKHIYIWMKTKFMLPIWILIPRGFQYCKH